MLQEVAQAQDNPVPIRQDNTPDLSGQPASELPSAHRPAHDHHNQPIAHDHHLGAWNHTVLPVASNEESKVLLSERQGDVLFQVHPQTHVIEARGHQLFS